MRPAIAQAAPTVLWIRQHSVHGPVHGGRIPRPALLATGSHDLAFSALTWVPLLTAEIAEQAGFGDAAGRRRRFHLLLDAYGYTGGRTAIRAAIIGRTERNVAMIRQLADGGEPTFHHMQPWATDLERSGNEVAEQPDEF